MRNKVLQLTDTEREQEKAYLKLLLSFHENNSVLISKLMILLL